MGGVDEQEDCGRALTSTVLMCGSWATGADRLASKLS